MNRRLAVAAPALRPLAATVATGVVTRGEPPWFPSRPLTGRKVSLSVEDGDGRIGDRIGWPRGCLGTPISDGQGTVPFIRTTSGDFTARG